MSIVGKGLNTFRVYNRERRVCVSEAGAKNLATEEPQTEKAGAGATQKPSEADIKGKIVEYLWHLKKQGYAESTVKVWTQKLKELARKGANLLDPESVKYVMASHNWSNAYKLCLVCAYQHFVKMLGMSWEPPSYTQTRELPFIPLEKEIDALIAGCGKKVAASLQLLKETAMRIGEAWQLRWIDIDEERQTIRCRSEKGGNPRLFKVSGKLIAMLNTLPRTSDRVFGEGSLRAHRWNFVLQRKGLALKLQNPRLNKITFHTLRHWKATMEYHRTKDILHVKQLLGHKAISSTLVYTQLISFEGDDYHVKVARTLDEACELAKAGFDYFTTMDGVQIFRKRK